MPSQPILYNTESNSLSSWTHLTLRTFVFPIRIRATRLTSDTNLPVSPVLNAVSFVSKPIQFHYGSASPRPSLIQVVLSRPPVSQTNYLNAIFTSSVSVTASFSYKAAPISTNLLSIPSIFISPSLLCQTDLYLFALSSLWQFPKHLA